MSRISIRLLPALMALCLLSQAAHAQDYLGWWWDRDAPGTGYSLGVQDLPDKAHDLGYLVWYLYDESGLNTWYSAVLKVHGNTMIGQLVEYAGWPQETGVPQQPEIQRVLGDCALVFSDPDHGTLSYRLDDVEYQKDIERWEQDGSSDPRDLNGWWLDPDKPGTGWFMEARNSRLFLGWFNYREAPGRMDGMPRWFISLDNDFSPEDAAFNQSVLDYSGGQTLTGPYAEPSYSVKGEGNLEFTLPSASIPQELEIACAGEEQRLTRFQIPDIFQETCAPVHLSHEPAEEVQPYLSQWPWTRLVAQSPCGNPIDLDSIEMRLNGVVLPITVESAIPSRVDIQCSFHDNDFSEHENFDATVEVDLADSMGSPLHYTWTFHVGYFTY